MTAKEKAIELVDFYLKLLSDVNPMEDYLESAKRGASRCVYESIKSQEKSNDNYGGHSLTNLEIEFYQKVKQEINKL